MTDPTERIRSLCLALDGVTEKLSHGEASWFSKRQFVMMSDHHHDDRMALWAAAPEGAQQKWVAIDSERFFVPPYVGKSGWVGAYLDVPLDDAAWDDIAEIVEDAWQHARRK